MRTLSRSSAVAAQSNETARLETILEVKQVLDGLAFTTDVLAREDMVTLRFTERLVFHGHYLNGMLFISVHDRNGGNTPLEAMLEDILDEVTIAVSRNGEIVGCPTFQYTAMHTLAEPGTYRVDAMWRDTSRQEAPQLRQANSVQTTIAV